MTVAERATALVELLPRPLDPVRSVKLKISILLLVSGGVGLAYLWFEFRWQPPIPISLVTVALVLLTAQVLGHGMTRPLRAMTAAARAMAHGDYSRRVRATSRDEIGELAVAFNQMAADLAAADGRRRELIANVSHELRTPVAALQAVLENLVDGVAEPDAATLSTALGQTERLGRLVAELLDLSRIDAGAVPLDLADVPVAELIAQTIAEAEAAARAAGRDVTVRADVRPAAVTVRADRGRLHQVLLNLLDNAARHGPPGGVVRVTARTERGSAGDRGERRRSGHRPGRARAGVPPVHPRGAGRRGWHRAGAGHRPLGGRPARRSDRRGGALGRPGAGRRRAAWRRAGGRWAGCRRAGRREPGCRRAGCRGSEGREPGLRGGVPDPGHVAGCVVTGRSGEPPVPGGWVEAVPGAERGRSRGGRPERSAGRRPSRGNNRLRGRRSRRWGSRFRDSRSRDSRFRDSRPWGRRPWGRRPWGRRR